MRENIEKCVEIGENGVKSFFKSKTLTRCKLPVTLFILDPKTKKESFFNFCKAIRRTFKYNVIDPKKRKEWWLSRQYYVNQSSLNELKTFTLWQLDNAYKLENNKTFMREWPILKQFLCQMLYLLKLVDENKKTTNDITTVEFKRLKEFYHFGYVACQVMGGGYLFKSLEKDMPTPFLKFKNIQDTFKEIYNGASKMEVEYVESIRDEIKKWN